LWALDLGVALGLGVAFLVFSATFRVLAAFFTGRAFTSLRVGALAALARLVLGREGFVFIARFAVLAEGRLTDGRVVDRRKAFVRLLLMRGISKDYSTESRAAAETRGAYHSFAPKSMGTTICGRFNPVGRPKSRLNVQTWNNT
jgi:hypothetical protein